MTIEAPGSNSQPLRLSRGELAALAQLVDSDGSRVAIQRLGLEEYVRSELALHIGLSALIARGLASRQDDRIETAAEGTPIALSMVEPAGWIEVGLMAEGSASGALVSVGSPISMLYGAADSDTYEILPLDAGTVPVDAIVSMVATFLFANPTSLAVVETERSEFRHRVTVARNEAKWQIQQGDDDPMFLGTGGKPPSAAQVRRALRPVWPS